MVEPFEEGRMSEVLFYGGHLLSVVIKTMALPHFGQTFAGRRPSRLGGRSPASRAPNSARTVFMTFQFGVAKSP